MLKKMAKKALTRQNHDDIMYKLSVEIRTDSGP